MFLLILAPAFVWATGPNSSFRCRWALSHNRGQLFLNEADDRSNGRLLDGPLLTSSKRAANLDAYFSQIDIRNLAVQLRSDRLPSEILNIIYGDKFSIIKKWSSDRSQYQQQKHQQLIREFLLHKGLVEIFREIGHDSPTFLTRLKIRVRSILKNSGLLWVIARVAFRPFDYQEIPLDLTEKIILQGWDASQKEIQDFFRDQYKRELFNDWHQELGLIVGGILTITSYFNTYDQTLQHLQAIEQSTVSQYSSTKSVLEQQRVQIQSQIDQEQALVDSINRQLENSSLSNPPSPTAMSPRRLSEREQSLLRQTILGEE